MTNRATSTSEPLVPKGRPQGDRQKLEANMELAGISKDVGQQGPAPAGGQGGQGRPAPEGVPRDFDVLANRDPAQPQFADPAAPSTGVSRLQELILTSPNPFYRELASRLLTGA